MSEIQAEPLLPLFDEPKPKSVYGSASAFAFNGIPFTDSSTGCFRAILVASHNIRTPFPEHIAKIGAANEERYQGEKLGNNPPPYEREMVVKEPIPGFGNAVFSGRIDFWVAGEVHELKSISSVNVHKDVIEKGLFKIGNLAQTVSYMIAKEVTVGRLVYTSYAYKTKPPVDRIFHVTIDDLGVIWVDGKATPFTVQDQLEHRYIAARVVTQSLVWPERPFDWENNYKSPCKFCTWKKACANFDEGNITDTNEFLSQAKEALDGI